MKTLRLVGILLTTIVLFGCSIMPPRRQYVKEAKRQLIPKELLNTHWMLELWDNKAPGCNLTLHFYEKGRFTFKWNDLNFQGDNLWYIVKDSTIAFHTRPIEKIAWTTENHGLEPDNFALDLSGVTNFKMDNNKLILASSSFFFVFKKCC